MSTIVPASKSKPRFKVQIDHDDDDGLYYVRCLDLQGCHSFGKTRKEALEMIREAIAGHLAVSLHADPEAASSHGQTEVVELLV